MAQSQLTNIYTGHQRGQTLVEMLVVIGLSAIMLPALTTALVASREGRAQEAERLRGTALLAETDEAVRIVRQKDWEQFAVNGTFYPYADGGTWSLAAGTETANGFTRSVVISDVQRNAGGAIVASGGTVDPSTKKVVTTVSWSAPLSTTISNTAYFDRYLDNAARTHTTQAELDSGTKTNTTVTATGGGQVELTGTVGAPVWATPSIIGAYDQASSTTDAVDVFVDSSTNRAYVAIGATMRIINVANPAAPALLGTFSASGNINSIYVVGNYAYLATAANAAELTVVNVTTPSSPVSSATRDVGDTADALSIFVTGGYVFLGKAFVSSTSVHEFYIYNVSTPTNPTANGTVNLSGSVNSIHVNGNFAYLAMSTTTGELAIINVTSKTSPTVANAGYEVAGASAANDVFAVGTTVYLVKAVTTGAGEFFILNAATPASVTTQGSYEANATLNGVYVNGTLAFIGGATTNAQFTVLDITTPASITVRGSSNLANTINDIVQIGDYAYLASTSNTQELTIMNGPAAAGGYQASGTLESTTFDQTASAAYNYITFTITEPDVNHQARFQIATNNDNSTWTYVGPDGTGASFYDTPQAIRLGTIGRYMRYKITLTGNGTNTPSVQDLSINYSP